MTRSGAAVFLDRDGVINEKAPEGRYVGDWSEFRFLPGSVAALATLAAAGARLFIVTNQRGIARGMVAPAAVADMHARLVAHLEAAGAPIAGIYVCPHESGTCTCRKPDVGLFLQARRDHPWVDFASSHLVGDSLSDLDAGHRLGMRLWLVGDEDRRREVEARAAERGFLVAGSVPSLEALVAGGDILRSLGSHPPSDGAIAMAGERG